MMESSFRRLKLGSQTNLHPAQSQNYYFSLFLFFVTTLYVLIAAIVFQILEPEYADRFSNTMANTTYVDSLYFTVVTLTTVGYGDITPVNEGSKLFVSFMIVVSLFLVTALMDVTDFFGQLRGEDDENIKLFVTPAKKRLIYAGMVLVVFVVIGIIFTITVEERSFLDSFYNSIVTLTTVGYGDITPQTQSGKIFSIIWICGGCVAFFRTLGAFMDVLLEGRKKKWKDLLRRRRESIGLVLRENIISVVDEVAKEEEAKVEESPSSASEYDRKSYRPKRTSIKIVTEGATKDELISSLTEAHFILYRLEKQGLVNSSDILRYADEYEKVELAGFRQLLATNKQASTIGFARPFEQTPVITDEEV